MNYQALGTNWIERCDTLMAQLTETRDDLERVRERSRREGRILAAIRGLLQAHDTQPETGNQPA